MAEPAPDPAPAPAPTPARPRPRRRWGLRLLVAASVLVAILALVAGVLVWTLGHLETDAVRGRVTGWARDRLALDLGYDTLGVSLFGGLGGAGLRLATPGPLAAHAPELLTVGRLDAAWDMAALIGRRVAVDRLVLDDVRLVVVRDETGATSLDALSAGGDPEPAAQPDTGPQPLSASLQIALPMPVAVDRLALPNVSLSLVDVEGGEAVRRVDVEGLSLEASARVEGADREVKVRLATAEGAPGTRITVHRPEGDGAALVRLKVDARVEGQRLVAIEATVELVEQGLDDRLPPPGPVLDLAARVELDSAAGRTVATLERLAVLKDAATATGSLELLDGEAGAGVRPGAAQAAARVDVGRILPLLPAGILPGGVEAGEVTVNVEQARLDPDTWLPASGSASAQADLRAAGVALEGLDVALASLKLGLRAGDVRVDAEDPRRSQGEVALDLAAEGLEVESPGGVIAADGARLTATTTLSGEPPYAVDLTLPLKGLRARDGRGRALLARTDGRVEVHATEAVPNRDEPRRSTGRVAASIDVGPVAARLKAHKRADAADYEVSVKAPQLGVVEPLLPPSVARAVRIAWRRLGLDVRSRGTVRGLARGTLRSLGLDHSTRVVVSRLDLTAGDLRVGARAVELDVASKGGVLAHAVDLKARVVAPRFGPMKSPHEHTITVKGHVDLPRSRVDVRTTAGGPAGPDLDTTLKSRFSARRQEVTHDMRAELGRLGPIQALLPETLGDGHRVRWEKLSAEVTSRGSVRGLVRRMVGGVRPIVAKDPLARARGDQLVHVVLRGLDYGGPERTVTAPSLDVRVEGVRSDDGLTATVHMETPRVAAAVGEHAVTLEGWTQRVRLTADDLKAPRRLHVDVQTRLKSATQGELPGYPVGDLALDASVDVDRRASVRIDRLRLDNPAAGTFLDVTGVADIADPSLGPTVLGPSDPDRVPGRLAVSLQGEARQDLAAVTGLPGIGRAAGRVGVSFRLESGDRTHFRLLSTVRAEGVDLTLPDHDLEVLGADGRIPVVQELSWDGGDGVRLLWGASRNAWSRTRFQDVHPFFGTDTFLSVRSVRLRGRTAGPIAGNMRLDRNLFSVDQLQAEALGGHIAGQLLADVSGAGARASFRGNVTGLQASKGGDRLDANAALDFELATLSLDGRVQIVRIGRQHLLDALDLLDPYREDARMNQVRQALAVGWPERVRVRLDHGFLSAKLELGGVASVVRIDEIRGVPTGPLLQQTLGPLLDVGDRK